MKKLFMIILLSIGIPLLQSCVPVVVAGGVAAGAFVGSDPRSAAQMKADLDLYGQIDKEIGQRYPDNMHVTVTVINGKVLLTGEVPTAEVQHGITEIARRNKLTKEVYNQTVVAPTSGLTDRAGDSAITTKVKTALLSSSFANALHIKVLTERNVVYLIGIVSREAGEGAAQAASQVSGVERVVKLFEYSD